MGQNALREFVEQIVIPPGDELLKVVGNLGAMLEATAGQKVAGRQPVGNVGCGGSQPSGFGVCVGGGLSSRGTLSKRAPSPLGHLSIFRINYLRAAVN